MVHVHVHLLVLAVVVVVVVTATFEIRELPHCSQTCVYTEWAKDADCRSCGLTSVQVECPGVETLDLRYNNLSNLKAGTFSNFPELRYVDVGTNALQSIEPGSFAGTRNLLNIYAQKNKLQRIRNGTFVGASDLRELYLNNNEITEIERDGFQGIPELESLFLSNNNLTVLQEGLFDHLPKLQLLFIESNFISILGKNIFKGLARLKHLSLINNLLTHIPAGVFDNLWSLKTLKLSFNHIVSFDLGALPPLAKLTHFDLFRNNLTAVQNITEVLDFPIEDAETNYRHRRRTSKFREVFLGQNPLHCDCTLEPLRQWMEEKREMITGHHRTNATCESPEVLNNVRVSQLKDLCPSTTVYQTQSVTEGVPVNDASSTLFIVVLSLIAVTGITIIVLMGWGLCCYYLTHYRNNPNKTSKPSEKEKPDNYAELSA